MEWQQFLIGCCHFRLVTRQLTVNRCHWLLLCRYRLPVLREEHCNVLFGGDPFKRVFKPVPDVNIVCLAGGLRSNERSSQHNVTLRLSSNEQRSNSRRQILHGKLERPCSGNDLLLSGLCQGTGDGDKSSSVLIFTGDVNQFTTESEEVGGLLELPARRDPSEASVGKVALARSRWRRIRPLRKTGVL